MKILITTDWYEPVINGVVTSVLMLRRELEARGHEVRVVTLSNSIHSYKEGAVYYMGSVSANRIYPGARLKMNRTRSLLRELAAWRPDVIHSQCEFSTFRVASALSNRLGVPIVHTYHTVYEDYTHYFVPSVRVGQRVGRYVVTAFSRWICGRTACIVAPTGKVEQLLRRYGVRCRIEVIPTGVDLRAFRDGADPERLAALRRKWAIPENHTILLYLGRMAKEKNLETLMEQIAGANRKDITLLLVGDGPDREKALKRAHELGLSVIYTGMVSHEEAPDYYRLGDLFVTASTSETQGLTYFEALAAGVPVLCRRDSCVDGVVEDGINGWQYEDGETFSRCLQTFCGSADLRRKMQNAALQSAERFSAEAFGEAAERLYQSLQGQPVAMASGEH
ncbi:MAG: glycosyltransferase family 4 protein [Oscillospiraceae bacterium]|nr:glycosyltransferase family 4 protein [Oscillospiraceae bacterium]